MHIAIVGAGAMGGIMGAALARGGAEVSLLDVSESLVDRLNRAGLTIERHGEEETVRLPATTDPASIGVVDAVVFFVKCYHTEAAASLARPLVGPDTTVATLQNGWGNGDVLARHYDPERIVIGVTYHSGMVAEPARVRHTNTSDAPTLLGPYAGKSLDGAETLASAIRGGGFRADAFAAIRSEIWKKLVLNACALPTSALTRSTAGALTTPAGMRELVDGLIREAVAVGRANGFEVDEQERLDSIHGLLGGAGDGKASMLQDIEGGRRTEIDVINGAVVRAAEQVDVPVPLNRAVTALIVGYEAANGLA